MAFCVNCGAPLREGAVFCSQCGTAVSGAQNALPDQSAQTMQPASAVPPMQPASAVPPMQPDPFVSEQDIPDERKGNGKGAWIALGIVGAFLILCVVLVVLTWRGVEIPGISKAIRAVTGWEKYDEASDSASADDTETTPRTRRSFRTNDSADSATTEDEDTDTDGKALERTQITFVSSDVSDYPTVRVYFRIEDMTGQQVFFVDPDATIRERIGSGAYIEREIRRLMRLEGNEGLSIDLLADKSGSMDSSIALVQQVMTQFVNSLDYGNGDRAELISFDSYVMYMCTYTDNASLLANGITNMSPYGQTALYDALIEGVTNAAMQNGARCVIAFTDGMDNVSAYTAEDVIALAQYHGVPVYIIGTYGTDTTVLERIASQTGGFFWYIEDLGDLSDILSAIYVEQKDLYMLEYVSDAASEADAMRTILCDFADDLYTGSIETAFTPVKPRTMETHTSRYEIVQADCSWTEANSAALQKGGHLATITSEEEQQLLSRMAEDAGLKYIWIGGYTSVRGDTAYGHWITGEEFFYTAWFREEPSRNDLDGTPEMYLMLWNVDGTWNWNDQRNDPIGETNLQYFVGKTGYIIEYED